MLTQRQEQFCLNIFQGMTQREAWVTAGYSGKYAVAIIDKHACELANSGKIKGRIDELRSKLADEAISTEKERRKILTQIQRATVADFVDEHGNLSIKDSSQLRTSAIQEIKTVRTLLGYRTTLKLRDPVGAIDTHNKMDRIYSEIPASFQDNRTINIIVSSDKAKELTEKVSGRLLDG